MKRRALTFRAGPWFWLGLAALLLLSFSIASASPNQPASVTLSEAWKIMPDLPYAVERPAVAALNGYIHIVGGIASNDVVTNTHVIYDPLGKDYAVALEPYPLRVENASAVAAGGRLFVIGGWDAASKEATDAVYYNREEYDWWWAVPPLLTPVSGAGAAVVGDTIYVIGGWNSSGRRTCATRSGRCRRCWAVPRFPRSGHPAGPRDRRTSPRARLTAIGR